jgi:hypothetical protein
MRNSSHIPFAVLKDFLSGLGFTNREVNGASIIFEHAPSETLLFFRTYQPREKVDQTDLVVVRKFLDEKGLMDREEFERWAWQQTAASA